MLRDAARLLDEKDRGDLLRLAAVLDFWERDISIIRIVAAVVKLRNSAARKAFYARKGR